ncbi:MAG: TetR/AcrR family transcriptional regulator [Clostridiales bacterium]|nr:TetR/AcrR family transcriptional regulator [Clostridiales bacterium]
MPFHKETFDRIPQEKRDHIFTIAVSEFAQRGYAAASINGIARKAGISIGSMYSYFDSKEDLFLAIVDKGYELLERVFRELSREGSFRQQLLELLHTALRYARQHPDMNNLYLGVMTEELAPLSMRLSSRVEKVSVNYYHHMLQAAVNRGELRADLDIPLAAYLMDNNVLMLQLACSSGYHRYRLQHFVGERAENLEQLANSLCDLIMRCLQ